MLLAGADGLQAALAGQPEKSAAQVCKFAAAARHGDQDNPPDADENQEIGKGEQPALPGAHRRHRAAAAFGGGAAEYGVEKSVGGKQDQRLAVMPPQGLQAFAHGAVLFGDFRLLGCKAA